MGAFGVAMGFAAFILIREEGKTPAVFLTGLLAAALTSYVIEAVRERAEGGNATHRPEPGRVLGLLVLLAIFEIFVSGVEKSVALVSAGEAGAFLDQVFVHGITGRVGAVVQLVLFTGLWVALGGAAAWSVVSVDAVQAGAPPDVAASGAPGTRPPWRTSLRRVGVGLALVGAMALAYVLVSRLAVTIWVLLTRPQDYRPGFITLLEASPRGAGEVVMQLPVLLAAGLEALAGTGRWGGVVLLAAVALLLALVRPVLNGADRGFGRRLVALTLLGALGLLALGPFATSGEQFAQLLRIVGASTLIWLVPLTVLALARPQLDRPARSPRLWGIVSFVVALLLVALTWDRLSEPPVPLYVATLTTALVVTSWLFLRGADVVRFWPLVALTLAIAAFEGSSLLQRLTFLTTFKEAALLQGTPLQGGDERRAERGFTAVEQWRDDSLVEAGAAALVREVQRSPSDPAALDGLDRRLSHVLDSVYTASVTAVCRASGSPVLDALHRPVAGTCALVRDFAASAATAATDDSAAASGWQAVRDTLSARLGQAPWEGALDAALRRGGDALAFEWYRLRWEDPADPEMREVAAHARLYVPPWLLDTDPSAVVAQALGDPSIPDSARGWSLLWAFAVSDPPSDSVRAWTETLASLPLRTDGRVTGFPISMTIGWWASRHRRLLDLFEARHAGEIPFSLPPPMMRRPPSGTAMDGRRQTRTIQALRFAHDQLQLRRRRLRAGDAYAADAGAALALELSLGASFAFWATAGLLAGLAARAPGAGSVTATPANEGGAEGSPPAPPSAPATND